MWGDYVRRLRRCFCFFGVDTEVVAPVLEFSSSELEMEVETRAEGGGGACFFACR